MAIYKQNRNTIFMHRLERLGIKNPHHITDYKGAESYTVKKSGSFAFKIVHYYDTGYLFVEFSFAFDGVNFERIYTYSGTDSVWPVESVFLSASKYIAKTHQLYLIDFFE